MKKIIALVMVLAMLLVSAACAEATYSYTEYNYDETMFEGVGGEWLALPDLGLQFYLPDIFNAEEVTEELAAVGTFAYYTTNASGLLTLSYGPALNAEGNPAEYAEDLAEYFTARGMANVDVIFVNGMAVVTSYAAESDSVSYSVFFVDGSQCVFTFYPASDANHALVAGLMITSLMPTE